MSEQEIISYCARYNIPRKHLIDILEDQKVLPMIRGKATEYADMEFVKHILSNREWSVEKLNLNPQFSGDMDEDISITFKRSGDRLKAETKNATRGSFRHSTKNRPYPHFTVKCHKSRSNLKRKNNDCYLVEDFDIIMCNVSNALFRNKTLDPGIHLIENEESINWLKEYYQVEKEYLFDKAYEDWRFCIPASIAEEKNDEWILPRCPVVRMADDPHWFRPGDLHSKLRSLINGTDHKPQVATPPQFQF